MSYRLLFACLVSLFLVQPAFAQDDGDTGGGDDGGNEDGGGGGGDTGGGQQMDPLIRSQIEDDGNTNIFSDVQVHSDSESDRMNDQVDARAYTHRGNVAFAPGQYSPENPGGRRLLAHELTHTLQQQSTSSEGGDQSDEENSEEEEKGEGEEDARDRAREEREQRRRRRNPD